MITLLLSKFVNCKNKQIIWVLYTKSELGDPAYFPYDFWILM